MTTRNTATKTAFAFTAATATKGLLAALAAGALFAAAAPANAKNRAHHAAPPSHWSDAFASAYASVPAQARRNPMPGGIYESLSGGRHFFTNPDRDFAAVGNRPSGGAEYGTDESPF